MTRNGFIKKLVRLALFAILSLIGLALGKKAMLTGDCSTCPGLNSCNGRTDCNKY